MGSKEKDLWQTDWILLPKLGEKGGREEAQVLHSTAEQNHFFSLQFQFIHPNFWFSEKKKKIQKVDLL